MELVTEGNIPQKSLVVDVPISDLMRVYKICTQMESLCEKEKGIGLSAVQVGLPWNLFLVKSDGSTDFVDKNKYGYFVNCSYKPVTGQKVTSLEGCLSLRSSEGRLRYFQVERYADIQVTGHQLIYENYALKLKEINHALNFQNQAIVFQHEIDHQLGVLISQIGNEVVLWQNF